MFVKVTAKLSSPMRLGSCGEAPALDGLLEFVVAERMFGCSVRGPAERPRSIPTPIVRVDIDGLSVPRCSSGIIDASPEFAEHYHCSFNTSLASTVREKQRTAINPSGGDSRSLRLPMRLTATPAVVWFAEIDGSEDDVQRLLPRLTNIGSKSAYGYGMVTRWTVEATDIDASWFHGGVLMRPLPVAAVSPEIRGKRRCFGSVAAPYWQQSFFVDRYVPSK